MLSHYQPEPAPHSYKIYVGAIVAILLAVLVYMTWRSNSAFWSSSTVPAALPQAGPPARPSEAASAEPNSDNAVTTTRASAAAPRQNPRSQNHRKTATRAEENSQRMTTRPAAQIVPVAASAATGAGQNGSEELAMAERYLRAGPGRSRDSQEAVIWLWKAVAKQNLTATTLLSDLYLGADGVTKNC